VKRLISAAAATGILASLVVAVGAPAVADTPVLSSASRGEFQAAADGPYLSWEENTKKRPNRYHVFVRGGGLDKKRVNFKRMNAANGGIDGSDLVFQQYKRKWSNIKMFDLDTLKRSNPPAGVNSKHWEYWPSISDGNLLFGRLFPKGGRRLLLADLEDGGKTLLARTKGTNKFLAPGQVNGDHVVWSRCAPKSKCQVFHYDIPSGVKTRIPNPGRFQRAPSVSSNGAVYFVRSNQACGRNVKLMRYLGGEITSLVTLPQGRDITDTFVHGAIDGLNDVYYENSSCLVAHRSDIFKLDDQAGFELTVTKEGDGTVTSTPAGIDCGSDCSEFYDAGETVTLTATPPANTTFEGWSGGGCSGTGTCTVEMSESRSVTATFAGIRQLTVVKAGTGTGNVFSSPAGINCGSDCSESYENGTVVTLTASPTGNSDFGGWSGGACTGIGTCTVTMDASKTVTATFTPKFTLVVSKLGAGDGTVTSNPAGINCGGDCDHTYPPGTVVTLSAFPNAKSTFAGWSGGGCSGTGTCTVTVTQTVAVAATFTSHKLTVTKTGGGSGTVTSNPAGINCEPDCEEMYRPGDVVVLTANPTGSVFTGWTGCDSPSGTQCTMTMNADKTVTANFEGPKTLTVNKTSTSGGTGTVTSTDDDGTAGNNIDCGSDCVQQYPHGTTVTLTAAADSGSAFTGWSGEGCSGTGTCVVTMDAPRTVTANFEVLRTLTVNKDGTGTGTVTSTDDDSTAGNNIDCGSDCVQQYPHGTTVTLTAAADSGSAFTGWSGEGCSGTGTCVVTMDAPRTVTATFNLATPRTAATGASSLDGWAVARIDTTAAPADRRGARSGLRRETLYSFGGGAGP
jgi:hypothetical protein